MVARGRLSSIILWGPPGVGKTTLFKTIVGLEEPDSGSLKVGETVQFSYVDQNRAGIDPDKYWPPVARIDQAYGDRNL